MGSCRVGMTTRGPRTIVIGDTPCMRLFARSNRKHAEQNGLCYYCEQPAWLAAPPPPSKEDNLNWLEERHANRRRQKTRATRGHLIPKRDGGTDDDSNIVMACAACNHERGDAPVDTWKSYVLARADTCILEIEMPRVLNKHRDGIPPGAVYIGRNSPWGNPFPIKPGWSRDRVCDAFEEHVLPDLEVEPLRGKDLVCFCAPLRCHGASIMKKSDCS
jgi:hypothetical protein